MPRDTYAFSQKELRTRATVPLTQEMNRYLGQLSLRFKDLGGKHIDRSQLLRSLIRALMELEGQVDLHDVDHEDVLVKRLVAAFRKQAGAKKAKS